MTLSDASHWHDGAFGIESVERGLCASDKDAEGMWRRNEFAKCLDIDVGKTLANIHGRGFLAEVTRLFTHTHTPEKLTERGGCSGSADTFVNTPGFVNAGLTARFTA